MYIFGLFNVGFFCFFRVENDAISNTAENGSFQQPDYVEHYNSLPEVTTRDLEKELLNTNWARTTQFNLDECQLPASAYIHHWVKDPQDPQYQQSGARLGNWYLQDKLSTKDFCELLSVMKNCDKLLLSDQLTQEEEQQKRKLLALLISINWDVHIPSLQVKFLKQMEIKAKQNSKY